MNIKRAVLDAEFTGPHGLKLEGSLYVTYSVDAGEYAVQEVQLQIGPHYYPYNGSLDALAQRCRISEMNR
jgi:hypothetical protein